MINRSDTEAIELVRGGAVVSTMVGAFGASIRETRLTALLGYLVALNPNPFLIFFGFTGKPTNGESSTDTESIDQTFLWKLHAASE